jgi:acyl dehydratase
MNDESGLVRGAITDESIEQMRSRIGYPNPTVRAGILTLPWNSTANADAIRRFAQSNGDMNPLYAEPGYAETTRWGGPVAPPGFEWSMGFNRNREVPEDLFRATRSALRGVQLYHSGAHYRFYRPILAEIPLFKSEWISNVEEKESRFADRTVLVTNSNQWWDAEERVYSASDRWFVHAERRKVSSKDKNAKDEPPFYTDDQMAEIEAAYDSEYVRGPDTLYLEDCEIGQKLPRMVKGPLTITDMINTYMGAGWLSYGSPPFRLAYENRKLMRGFYSRDAYNAWDSVQRVHWDQELAGAVGVQRMYDIGPMRYMMICHYLSNFAGDDGWVHEIRYELRNFNYVGDVTWIDGTVTAVRDDPDLGPLVELEITGTNQRGQLNIQATATVLVASRERGLAALPPAPPVTEFRRRD